MEFFLQNLNGTKNIHLKKKFKENKDYQLLIFYTNGKNMEHFSTGNVKQIAKN